MFTAKRSFVLGVTLIIIGLSLSLVATVLDYTEDTPPPVAPTQIYTETH